MTLIALLLTDFPALLFAQSSPLFGNASGLVDENGEHHGRHKPQSTPTPSPAPGGDAQQVWRNTGTDFNAGASWVSGVAPGIGDVAAFSGAEVTNPQLTANTSNSGLYFTGTGTSGYDLTRTGTQTLTLTGFATSIGSETGDANAVAIGAENTSGTNTIDVPIILAPTSGTTSTVFQAGGGTLVMNGVISGSGISLIKTGGGTLTLSGANTYSGLTTVSAGTLVLSGTNSSAGGTTLTGGILQLNNASNGGLASGALTLAGGTIQALNAPRSISNATTETANSTIGGSQDLTFNGTFTTGLNIGGTALTINNTGTTTFNGNVYLAQDDTNANSLTLAGSGNVVINGTLANNNFGNTVASNFTLNSTGTLTLNGTNNYNGATILTAGTLILGNKLAFGFSSGVAWNGVSTSANTNLSGANKITNNGTLGASGNVFTGTNSIELGGQLTNAVTGTNTITNNISGGSLIFDGLVLSDTNNTNRTLAFNGSGNTVLSGFASNGGNAGLNGLLYSGTGSLTLGEIGSYHGDTTLDSGTLNLNSNTAIGSGNLIVNGGTINNTSGGLITINSGATWNSDFTFGGSNNLKFNFGLNLTAAASTITLNGAGSTLTFAGQLGNSSSGANTITVNGVGNTLVLGSYGFDNTGGVSNLTDVFNGSGNVTITGTLGFVNDGLAYNGTGTFTLDGASHYSGGTTVNSGTLALGNSGVVSSGGAIASSPVGSGLLTLNSGATLRSDSTTARTIQNSLSLSGAIALGDATNNGAMTFNSTDGTHTLTTAATVTLTGNTTLTTNSAVTIADVVSGGFSLTKSGPSTLTLSGANTYGGATTINAGTLSVDNNNTTTARLAGTSNITVNSGGTLLLTQSGGTPSNDRINNVATMTLNGGTFDTGGLSEHGASNNTAGIGALTLTASSIINMGNGSSIIAFATSHLATWTGTLSVYNWSGSQSGGGTDQLYFGNDNTGLTAAQLGEINIYSDNGSTLLGVAMILADGEIVPIPEPGTWFAGTLAFATAVFAQRRRLVGREWGRI